MRDPRGAGASADRRPVLSRHAYARAPRRTPVRRSVSFVIPSLNEEAAIGPTLEAIPAKELREQGWQVEVLVVDGDSKDRTREVAAAKGATVILEPRRGYGRAYKTGFEKARGEILVTGDADGTYPFELAPQLLEQLDREALDFITTDRFADLQPGAMRAKHKVGNWILSTATRVLFFTRFRDSQSGMWVFRRAILSKLQLTADGMAFSEELKIEAFRKARAKEVGIPYRVRVGEVKLQSWRDGFRNLGFLFRKRFGFAK